MLKHKITLLFTLYILCFSLLIISCAKSSDTVSVDNNKSKDNTIAQLTNESIDGMNKDTQNKVQSEKSNEPLQKGFLYDNKELGFSILIPESWKDKYTLKESDRYVSFYHQYNTHSAVVFSISVEDESKWNAHKFPADNYLPIKKLGILNSLVYYASWPDGAPYGGKFEDIQKASDEYYKMSDQIDSIISSFKFID